MTVHTLAIVCAGALAGCGQDRNARLTIGRHDLIETVRESPRVDAHAAEHGAPSLTHGLDRSHWTAHAFLAPIDGVAHQPTYTLDFGPPDARTNPRARGDYPTASDALRETGDPAVQLMHMAASPFVAGLEIALFPFRVFGAPPWAETQSPPDRGQE